jgi:hypothetical protein
MSIEGNRLWMYVIYYHPRDYPTEFVCRRCYPEACHIVQEMPLFTRGATLEAVRAQIPQGQVCVKRSPTDDPVIVETWF